MLPSIDSAEAPRDNGAAKDPTRLGGFGPNANASGPSVREPSLRQKTTISSSCFGLADSTRKLICVLQIGHASISRVAILHGFDFTAPSQLQIRGSPDDGARFQRAEINHKPPQRSRLGRTSPPVVCSEPCCYRIRESGSIVREMHRVGVPEWGIAMASPDGAVLQDAPFGPEMVVIPPGGSGWGSGTAKATKTAMCSPARSDDPAKDRGGPLSGHFI